MSAIMKLSGEGRGAIAGNRRVKFDSLPDTLGDNFQASGPCLRHGPLAPETGMEVISGW